MRWLANYIRQIFCAHNYEKDECDNVKIVDSLHGLTKGTRVSMICTKCGYHKSFWKYI